jgi:hypothetical protein
MARTFYHDFLAFAQDEYDISYREAQAYYRGLREYQDFTEADFRVLMGEEVEEPEVEDIMDMEGDLWDWLADRSDGDYELDAGFELEITATTEGGTPRKGK